MKSLLKSRCRVALSDTLAAHHAELKAALVRANALRSFNDRPQEFEIVIRSVTLPTVLSTRAGDFILRRATADDLGPLMVLLSDDPISAARGDRAMESDTAAYRAALVELIEDQSNELLVVIGETQEILATMQLTRIPGMARRGATRLLIEAVRVASSRRSAGIGSAMMRWVIDAAAPAVGASLVQLTSDEARKDAHRFYERLGFVGSHRGFKLRIE
ncbi:GNAT family N-acetyltransferase [Diaminobutyricimonas sp. LJ205]|uniref:GNAT family N-acetyltransferase n=1 Tax=Diaminobutyricimonas sp. LJ205 TaxID=2683590 RepID=UPI003519D848